MLIDRFSFRVVMLPGVAIFALAVAALSAFQNSSLALIYVLFATTGLFAAVQTMVPYIAIISKWFDRDRGLALGLATAGVGLGVLVVPQLAGLVIRAFGWRMGYLSLGAMVILFAFVPIVLLVRDPSDGPPSVSHQTREAPSLSGLTLAQALTKSWRFWSLSIGFFLAGVSIHGTLIHSVALLTDRGIGVQAAAAIYSSVGLAMTAGRVACGYCLDKLHGSIISIGSFVIPMVGIGLLATGIGGAVPLLGILLCGLGMGAQIGLQSFFPSRYFGLKAIGAISGVIFGLFLAGVGLGPYISGVSFDTWHSYIPAFVGYLVALTVAALFFAPLGPYPFAVRKPTAN